MKERERENLESERVITIGENENHRKKQRGKKEEGGEWRKREQEMTRNKTRFPIHKNETEHSSIERGR